MPQTIPVDDFTLTAELPETETGLPPVLLVHGICVSTWCFEHFLKGFAAHGFPTYAVPLSGREGGRPGDLGKLTIGDFADDVRDALVWIAHEHGQRPILLGHSMGGLIAQKVAAENEVAALVLISPAPPRGIPLINPRLWISQLRALPQILRGKAIVADMREMDSVALNHIPVDQRVALHPQFVPDSSRAARELSLGAIVVDENRIRCPVLCVTGADDRLVPPAVTGRVAARYHAAVWTYADHGHFIVMEPGVEKVIADLAQWLEHVVRMRDEPTRMEDLWTSLQQYIGEVVDFTFFDGKVVRAEMVSVDRSVRRAAVYRLISVKQPGTSPARTPAEGESARASLHELAAVIPAVA